MPGAKASLARATGLSQVSGCPFRVGRRWGRRACLPHSGHLFLAKATPALSPRSPGTPELARAAGEALPAASRSSGHLPIRGFPRPALSLRHPQSSDIFRNREAGSRGNGQCLHPASAAAPEEAEEEEELASPPLLNWNSSDNGKNQHITYSKSPGYTHPGSG